MKPIIRISLNHQSSTKIKQLYQQFQSLKKRITISQNKRQKSIKIDKGHDQQKITNEKIQNIKCQDTKLLQTQINHIFQLKFIKYINQNLPKLTHSINEKLFILEKRLEVAHSILYQIPKCIKYKINCQRKKISCNCKCKVKAINIMQIESRCNEQINKLKEGYQNKISVLMNEMKDIGTSSSSHKNIDKQLQYQLRNLQEKLLIKQQDLNDIQIQNTQLRNNSEHMKRIIKRKDDLIDELKKQLQENNKQYTNVKKQFDNYKHNISKINQENNFKQQIKQFNIEQNLVKLQLQQTKLKLFQMQKQSQIFSQQLNKNIQKLNQKVKKYQDQIKRLKIKEKIKEQEIQKLYNSSNNKSKIQQIQNQQQWGQSFIQRRNTQNSQEQNIFFVEKIGTIEKFRYSSKQKKSKQLQYRIKQLQPQLQLVIQENKLLKSKKSQFLNQVQGSEQNEQKFQIKCQLLRQQIKKLNHNLKLLDQCALILLNKGFISISLQFAKEYKKQFIV